jgi:hypothetical protein
VIDRLAWLERLKMPRHGRRNLFWFPHMQLGIGKGKGPRVDASCLSLESFSTCRWVHDGSVTTIFSFQLKKRALFCHAHDIFDSLVPEGTSGKSQSSIQSLAEYNTRKNQGLQSKS